MFEPTLDQQQITESLISLGFDVTLNRLNQTNLVESYHFDIADSYGKKEVVNVFTYSTIEQTVFIETSNGKEVFGEDLTKQIEENIISAVLETPENKVAQYFYPITFKSKNFVEAKHFELNIENIEENFFNAMSNVGGIHNYSELSLYGFLLPRNNYEDLLLSLFEEVNTVYDIQTREDGFFVRFYKHNSSVVKEHSSLLKCVESFLNFGVELEVTSIL